MEKIKNKSTLENASGFLNLTALSLHSENSRKGEIATADTSGTSERREYVNTDESSLPKLAASQRTAQKGHSGAVRKKLLKEKKISELGWTL